MVSVFPSVRWKSGRLLGRDSKDSHWEYMSVPCLCRAVASLISFPLHHSFLEPNLSFPKYCISPAPHFCCSFCQAHPFISMGSNPIQPPKLNSKTTSPRKHPLSPFPSPDLPWSLRSMCCDMFQYLLIIMYLSFLPYCTWVLGKYLFSEQMCEHRTETVVSNVLVVPKTML